MSIQANYQTKNGQLTFQVEGKEQRDIFEQIASIQEVFDENTCGLCKKNNLRFIVRNVDDNNFYEYHCTDCGARLSLSQNKKGGTLYPVRKLKGNKPATVNDEGPFDFKTKGWYKWERKSEGTQPSAAQNNSPPAKTGNNKR